MITMTTDRERVRAIFHDALQRPDDERPRFIADACGDDERLFEEVRSYMIAMDHAGEAGFLGSPTRASPAPDPGGSAAEGPGTAIGRYRLLQQIGEGGFGVVYMAEQREPVKRKVALKIIKLGMDTRQVVARFEAERQALAMMDHPNIAKVLDGGATETGRPYFVMELVRGVPVTEYCDTNNVATAERLRLFSTVCRAVQHAHQKGIIHRDLKPSNVMVTLHDGEPVPKVIDFGIARATDRELTDKTLFTEFRQFVGTPEYMSPEQAEMSGLDIDTRSDIYSLGVLLYELLTGTTPFEPRQLREAALGEIQRIIREEQPPKPSTRLGTLDGGKLTSVAKHRHVEPATLARLMRGDLDWIVMRALEKDRTRRYESAAELARDVDRHLAREPVAAGPPSTTYRLSRFLSRHRLAVTAVTITAAALIIGLTVSVISLVGAQRGFGEARRERDAAHVAREEADAARQDAQENAVTAQTEAERARAVTDFLVDVLSLADPDVTLRSDVSVRSVLDAASMDLSRSFEKQPSAEAALRTTIGRAYQSLGEPELAAAHLRRALEIRDGDPDASRAETYEVLRALTETELDLEPPGTSLPSGRRMIAVGLSVIGEGQQELGRGMSRLLVAVYHEPAGQIEPRLVEAVELARASLRDGDPMWLIVADMLLADAWIVTYERRLPLAEPFLRAAVEIQHRELPPEHPDRARSLSMLVSALNDRGRFEESETLARESMANLRAVLPEGSWYAAASQSLLGECLTGQGRYAEAETELSQAHGTLVEALGEAHFAVTDSLERLIKLYDAWGRPEQAAATRGKLAGIGATARTPLSWWIVPVVFGPEHAALGEDLLALAGIVRRPGDAAERNRLFGERLDALRARRRAELPIDSPLAACVGRQLAAWSDQWQELLPVDVREGMIREALEILAAWRDRLPTDTARALAELMAVELNRGRFEEANLLARDALALMRQGHPEESWRVADARRWLGQCMLAQGRYAEAEAMLLEGYPVLLAQLGTLEPRTRAARRALIELYGECRRPELARPFTAQTIDVARRRAEESDNDFEALNLYAWLLLTAIPDDLRRPALALELAEKASSLAGPGNAAVLDTLARAYFLTGRIDEAIATQRRVVEITPSDHRDRPEFEQRLAEYEGRGGG